MAHDIAHLLIHRATVMRNTRTRDSGGGRTTKAETVATGVPCRASGQAMSTLYLSDGALSSDSARPVYFEPGTDVRQADVLHLYAEDDTYMGGYVVEAAEPGATYLKVRGRGQSPAFPNLPPPP